MVVLLGNRDKNVSFPTEGQTPQAVYVKTWDSPSEATQGLAVSEEALDKVLY